MFGTETGANVPRRRLLLALLIEVMAVVGAIGDPKATADGEVSDCCCSWIKSLSTLRQTGKRKKRGMH